MSIALFTVTFQGEPEVVGALDPEDRRECQREAFPRSPRRDAQSDTTYRSYKVAPLRSGRLLLSVAQNRGDVDVHGRTVLRATGCVLDRAAMAGPARDPAAVWSALESWRAPGELGSFETAVAAVSAWHSDAAFESLREALTSDGPFHARVAAALNRRAVVLSWEGRDDVGALRPALALLPASRLFKLELATGSIDSDSREAVIAVLGPLESGPDGHGLLGSLVGKWRGNQVTSVDYRQRAPANGEDQGPVELVQAIVDENPWPGFSRRERFRLLMSTLDSGWVDGATKSAFELSPEAEAMRRAVRQIEALTRRLETWR